MRGTIGPPPRYDRTTRHAGSKRTELALGHRRIRTAPRGGQGQMAEWNVARLPSQAEKTAIVTGATSGLGFYTALALAGAGAMVVLAGRSEAKGRRACARIRARHPAAHVGFETMDLASLDSIAAFANRFAARRPSLDLLINNAGVMAVPEWRAT